LRITGKIRKKEKKKNFWRDLSSCAYWKTGERKGDRVKPVVSIGTSGLQGGDLSNLGRTKQGGRERHSKLLLCGNGRTRLTQLQGREGSEVKVLPYLLLHAPDEGGAVGAWHARAGKGEAKLECSSDKGVTDENSGKGKAAL